MRPGSILARAVRPSRTVAAALLVCAVLLAHLPALHGGFIWDDREYVVLNPHLRSTAGLGAIWSEPRSQVQFYPMVQSVLWLEYRLWGDRPLGYHLVNLLLHAANAVLLWLFLARLGLPGAWFAAAVFGLHPLQAETVAWVAELKNTLSGLLALAAALAYLSFQEDPAGPPAPAKPRGRRARRASRYALALGLFVLALLSKTAVATLPAVLLVVRWWRTGDLRARDWLQASPFLLAGAAGGAATWWLETFHVGAQGSDFSLSLAERLLSAGRALWFYPAKLLWPAELMFIYPRWTIDPSSLRQWLFPLGAAAAPLAFGLLRRRLGRGPLAAILVYLLAIAPASGLLNFYFMKYSFVGDHFQYLACVGVLVLVAAPAARGLERAGAVHGPLAGRLLPAAVLVLLAAMTWRQTQVFRDEETLWRTAADRNPAARIALNNLAVVLRGQGRSQEALEVYRRAVSRWPRDADFRNDLALLLAAAGDPAGAAEQLRAAVRLAPERAEHRYNLGNVLAALGDLPGAREAYLAALERSPDSSALRNNFGALLMRLGRTAEAREQFARAVAIDPANVEAARNLARVRMLIGDP